MANQANHSHKTSPATAAPTTTRNVAKGHSLPIVYRLFFLLIEPISALVGAYYAFYRQSEYLQLTHAASAPHYVPRGTSIVLSQLANLYFLFAINEALVLRATSDLRVWKTVLFGLLIADFGHLYSVQQLGPQIYWSVSSWNAIDWGNIAFVYLGASLRIAFLADVGLGVGSTPSKKRTA
ncbi:hypothetical protein B0T22DRAFT_387580 [Podospora appendiculata]|uniref:DUF7704 domain-containing protein n=1 Tax=Podospora appendiculata TaxID=314037 RepID=A0AAE1C7P7_9PEZI|nr:hypothetical protein B0T22DRAFT_387580 [Podospora appendiculata]